MIDIFDIIYDIKQAVGNEFNEPVPIIRFDLTQETPPNNLNVDIYMGDVVYPFLIEKPDLEDVPTLIKFMIDHIKLQREILNTKGD